MRIARWCVRQNPGLATAVTLLVGFAVPAAAQGQGNPPVVRGAEVVETVVPFRVDDHRDPIEIACLGDLFCVRAQYDVDRFDRPGPHIGDDTIQQRNTPNGSRVLRRGEAGPRISSENHGSGRHRWRAYRPSDLSDQS